MDELERRLRDSLAHQVETPPGVLGLSDTVVRRGRRTRRRQAFGSSVALAAVLVTGLVLVAPDGRDDPQVAVVATPTPTSAPSPSVQPSPTYLDVAAQPFLDALPQGDAPGVPVVAGSTMLIGSRRVDLEGEVRAVQAWRGGVVAVVFSGLNARLVRWSAADGSVTTIEQFAVGLELAVAPDRERVTYVRSGPSVQRVVRDISDGTELSTPKLSPPQQRERVAGWIGNEVLIGVQNPDETPVRVEAWNVADGSLRVVGEGRYSAALATSRDGLVALTRTSDTCHEVSELPVRDGLWSTCEAYPVAFSPDSKRLLTAPGDSVVVVAARTGVVQRELALPFPGVTGYGWESPTAVLALVRTQAGGLQPLRCVVTQQRCERAGPALDLTGEMPLVVAARS